ncbi:MAG: hypothetical protein IKV57_07590 [Clostridia bacterium]|nr:hypothetical protein [Clostridia bacterium]
MIERSVFENPPKKYRVNPMMHGWPADLKTAMEALNDYGYGGAVTNVPFADGFTSNENNIKKFAEILDTMDAAGLSYWIYDEMGYPSGQGGGLTLEGHPEYAAKGFYMHRRIAYEPVHARYRLDDESDKIIWAAKYPVETPGIHESYVQFDRMIPVPFTETELECDLDAKEVLYVFCVKDAYEGTHSTHNVSSFRKNINIMDKRAVRRFIDMCFEPIVRTIPDAYSRALNVFTDEPSLHVAYVREYETWNYALAPWVDGLFEEFEKLYGVSILPDLPLLFEGGTNAYPIRIRFYKLVGKLIAEAWSGQLAQWCEAHGGGFSGHYLLEENITHHVKQYGDFLPVLRAASYPGIDILNCYPEIYTYNTAKIPQMAVRKNGSNGMMVEICPFSLVEEFKKDPLNNMTCVMGLLYLGGVRVTHSYFQANFSDWRGGALGKTGGYTNEAETNWFNAYTGRLGAVLDGLHNQCSTFIYYGVEDAQAKTVPLYSGGWNSGDNTAEASTGALMTTVYEAGRDFYYVDTEDLREALDTLASTGTPTISGNPVKEIFVPALDVMYREAVLVLQKLAEAGVTVRVVNHMPRFAAETGEAMDLALPTAGLDEIRTMVMADEIFPVPAVGGLVLRGRFEKDGQTIWMLVNKSRNDAVIGYHGADGEIWNPADGSVVPVSAGADVTVPAMRAVFVVS